MDLGIRGKTRWYAARARAWGAPARPRSRAKACRVTSGRARREALEDRRGSARRPARRCNAVAADITSRDGRTAALAACPQPDILVTNAGGPPPGDFRKWSREDWLAALDANMLTPIELIKATVDGMIARKFGRIVNITSSAVKAPIAMLGLSNGARSGLTGFVAGLARQTCAHNVTINNLLPGRFDTDRRARRVGAGEGPGRDDRGRRKRDRKGRSPPAASAIRPSSATRARIFAARRRATSPARIS